MKWVTNICNFSPEGERESKSQILELQQFSYLWRNSCESSFTLLVFDFLLAFANFQFQAHSGYETKKGWYSIYLAAFLWVKLIRSQCEFHFLIRHYERHSSFHKLGILMYISLMYIDNENGMFRVYHLLRPLQRIGSPDSSIRKLL